MGRKKIILGASGASGFPVLEACLRIISGDADFASCLIMSDNAKLTLVHEMGKRPEEYEKYDYEHVYAITVLFSQKTVNELTNQFDYEEK